jgi:predicted transcriptional regulator YdeE
MEKMKRAGFTLIGFQLENKTTNKDGQSAIDCGGLWQRVEKENMPEKIPGRINDDLYAVYFDYEGDHTQPYSYFIGCQVPNDTAVPDGMHRLSIPEGEYVQLLASGKMPDCVGDAWKAIWTSDIDRAYRYDFEVYDERSKNWEQVEVEIFLSVH